MYFVLFFQTVGFDAPAQLNKGTSTEESEADEADHFYYLTSASSPHVSGFEDDPNNCHLCHHNLALSPLTHLGVGTYYTLLTFWTCYIILLLASHSSKSYFIFFSPLTFPNTCLQGIFKVLLLKGK